MGIFDLALEILHQITTDLSLKEISHLLLTCRVMKSRLTPHFHYLGAQDVGEQTALQWAAEKGHASFAEMVIKRGVKVDAVGPRSLMRHPLQIAALHNNPDVIRILVKHGAWIHVKDSQHRTPLFLAVLRENVKAVEALLDLGAWASLSDIDYETPVGFAAACGSIDLLKAFIGSGFDIRTTGSRGRTILQSAAGSGRSRQPQMIQYLMEHEKAKTIINHIDHGYETVLDIAAWREYERDTIELLLQHGAKAGPARREETMTSLEKILGPHEYIVYEPNIG